METKKLTCCDIRIGDYVYSTFSDKPCKVQAIELSEHGYGSVRVTGVDGIKDIVSLSPIPLTAEVLEKNGFIKYLWDIYRLPKTDVSIEHIGSLFYLRISNIRLFAIKSVSHLQHLLRDFNVDKEIVL